MIGIVYKGMCEDCKYADLELDYIENCYGQKIWSVKCIHEHACDWTETRMIRREVRGESE